jgi:hypothetical protein
VTGASTARPWVAVVPSAAEQGTFRKTGRRPCFWRAWQGPSPLSQRQADPCPAGGQSHRPAPALPPWRALCSRRAGPWPAVGAGCRGLCGGVAQGRGKRGLRFLIPPKGAIPVPGPGRFSQQAGGRIAFSAPCKRPTPSVPRAGCAQARAAVTPPGCRRLPHATTGGGGLRKNGRQAQAPCGSAHRSCR